MSNNKKYYWLKLKSDFFEDDTISFIEEQKNGTLYVNFYLKLCLKGIKTDGKLIRTVGDTLIPYDIESLSKLTRTDPDTVKVSMELFNKIGLIQILDSGEIFLSQINEMVGSETNKARSMREKRAKEKSGGNIVTQSLPNVTQMLPRDRDRDRDRDREIYSPVNTGQRELLNRIIDYLNEKTGSHFKVGTKKTVSLIQARLNEKFTEEDFYKVIDVKTEEWLHDKKMKQFLRPITLFSNKFESYLNQEHEVKGGEAWDLFISATSAKTPG